MNEKTDCFAGCWLALHTHHAERRYGINFCHYQRMLYKVCHRMYAALLQIGMGQIDLPVQLDIKESKPVTGWGTAIANAVMVCENKAISCNDRNDHF